MIGSNIFSNLPIDLEDEFFENIVSKKGLKIERIVSFGHITPEGEWYDQDLNEWVLLLKGEAVISFEELEDVHLYPGDHLNIQAHQKHRVSWTKPDTKSVWLAVHYE